MIFEVSDGEAGIIGYFWKGSGLFSCLIGSVVFRESMWPRIQMKVTYSGVNQVMGVKSK